MTAAETNTKTKGVVRGKLDQGRAAELCDRLRRLDYNLMDMVIEFQDDLTLKAAGDLVAMHRELRQLRHQIEVEAQL